MSKTRYCFVVRHGQRADNLPLTYPKYIGHHDAMLTKEGHKQAAETGLFLKQTLNGIKAIHGKEWDKVILQSSPFIRTMSTASEISKEMERTEPFELNYDYVEYLSPWYLKKCPIDSLFVHLHPED